MFALLRRRKLGIVDESNHDSTEQESLSEQERFVQMEVTFTLQRKNGGYRISSLGSKSFPMVRQAGWLMKISLFKQILKSYS